MIVSPGIATTPVGWLLVPKPIFKLLLAWATLSPCCSATTVFIFCILPETISFASSIVSFNVSYNGWFKTSFSNSSNFSIVLNSSLTVSLPVVVNIVFILSAKVSSL